MLLPPHQSILSCSASFVLHAQGLTKYGFVASSRPHRMQLASPSEVEETALRIAASCPPQLDLWTHEESEKEAEETTLYLYSS